MKKIKIENKKLLRVAYFCIGFLMLFSNTNVKIFAANAAVPNMNGGNGSNELISTFSSSFNTGSTARAKNIKLAASALNGKILQSGETFSYNEVVGPTSKRRGFQLARIFIKGKDSKGYGGGVCQVSSTLYNTVLGGNFTVVERHPHSKKVSYVPEGKDAATSYGGIDFKFTNNKDYPIIISTATTKDSVKIDISSYLQN